MKVFFAGLFCWGLSIQAHGQEYLQSLVQTLRSAGSDSSRALSLGSLADYYSFIRADSAVYYARQATDLSEKINFPEGVFYGYKAIFYIRNSMGNYPLALEQAIHNLKIVENMDDRPYLRMIAIHNIGLVNFEMENYEEAIQRFHSSIAIQKKYALYTGESFGGYTQLAVLYLKTGHLDSALIYAQAGLDNCMHGRIHSKRLCLAIDVLGNVYEAVGKSDSAERYYKQALTEGVYVNNQYLIARIYRDLARFCLRTGRKDLCVQYAQAALQICKNYNFGNYALDLSRILVDLYRSEKKTDSALFYMQSMLAAKDSIFSQAKTNQFLLLGFDEKQRQFELESTRKQRQQEIERAKSEYRTRVRIYGLIGLLAVVLVLAFIFYRNNLQRKKTNRLLLKQKKDLEHTLDALRATQKQLIQSEKMASLGELTAGIAHEIQNPLNFVNNFSEVNSELLSELKQAVEGGDRILAMQLADDLSRNEEKISHHGKRADTIVKNMLMHSGPGSGKREPADLNALVEEYLRIAYHAARAKDKTFSVKIQNRLDPTVGKVLLRPQEMGRAISNFYSNAFYSMVEKKRKNDHRGEAYEPSLWVTTETQGNLVCLRIRDNGVGIPAHLREKILQPFFTTRPTGEGTGLGLSLSYDIITQLHGGKLTVDSLEGEYAEFIVQLPKS